MIRSILCMTRFLILAICFLLPSLEWQIIHTTTDINTFVVVSLFFFFQAEDGIRDYKVTGVQTCALPISENLSNLRRGRRIDAAGLREPLLFEHQVQLVALDDGEFIRQQLVLGESGVEIGRASCRERV